MIDKHGNHLGNLNNVSLQKFKKIDRNATWHDVRHFTLMSSAFIYYINIDIDIPSQVTRVVASLLYSPDKRYRTLKKSKQRITLEI